jgi:diacylglycerol kinase family enzyme
MRKAALLYNPDSGGRGRRRLHELQSALALLCGAGVDADLVPTQSQDHAGDETRRAIASGCDTVFACGGDGTIHNLIQVLAHSPVALAILPSGTANALAHDIGLPLNIVAAAEAALQAAPRRIALGCVKYTDLQGNPSSKYFVVAAGVGADAHLFYKLHTGTKQRMGMRAYYAKTLNLWFTYPMPRFAVEYIETGSDTPQRTELTELLAVRIRNFGGIVQELAPGASLDRDDMRMILCRTASRMAYLGYVARCVLRRYWSIPGIDLAYGKSVTCQPLPSSAGQTPPNIYVEADGELLGKLPIGITVVPNALTLLAPRSSTSS